MKKINLEKWDNGVEDGGHIRKKDKGIAKVVNIKKERCDVYIGRPSKWGNPFTIGRDGTREDVIEKYKQYILNNEKLFKNLPELKGKILGCFCKPLSCHGDILIELLEREIIAKRGGDEKRLSCQSGRLVVLDKLVKGEKR